MMKLGSMSPPDRFCTTSITPISSNANPDNPNAIHLASNTVSSSSAAATGIPSEVHTDINHDDSPNPSNPSAGADNNNNNNNNNNGDDDGEQMGQMEVVMNTAFDPQEVGLMYVFDDKISTLIVSLSYIYIYIYHWSCDCILYHDRCNLFVSSYVLYYITR